MYGKYITLRSEDGGIEYKVFVTGTPSMTEEEWVQKAKDAIRRSLDISKDEMDRLSEDWVFVK